MEDLGGCLPEAVRVRSSRPLGSWFGHTFVKLLLNKLKPLDGSDQAWRQSGDRLLDDAEDHTSTKLQDNAKPIKRCKPKNQWAKLNVQAVEGRLLRITKLTPEAKLAICSSKVQGD